MSKQYLTTHTIDSAHISDIFCLAVTPTQILSGGSASTVKIHSTREADFPEVQILQGAHKLGCHHLATSQDGKRAASVGFDGEVTVWTSARAGQEGVWLEECKIVDAKKAGELWAVALSEDGQYITGTTFDGRINVWDNASGAEKIREYETKGSFGMSIDLSADGRFTVSGHQNGGVYVFNNDTGRLMHSLQGKYQNLCLVCSQPLLTV
ncbi:MAG: superkiller [Piccolia ochrophora]|nr:MAG: superkiller [Piccolia ochrophora]